MLDNVIVYRQSSIKITKDKIIYFDPYKIEDEMHDADIIFITHDHYDHYDYSSIKNIMNDDTCIVVPFSLEDEVSKYFNKDKILFVSPLNEYEICGIKFYTVNSYNVDKKFHPRGNNWVGYVVNISGKDYYIMGDTDDTMEARTVKCDVLFIPIGGTYTMNAKEAVEYTNYVKPKIAVPIHYGAVVGSKDDALYFVKNLDKDINGTILIP